MHEMQAVYGYYPGCSAHATGQEYDASVRAVFEALGIELRELDGWNCCGASSAHNLSASLAIGLPARNLALVERLGLKTIAPCAACVTRLRAARLEIDDHPEQYTWLNEALDSPLRGDAVVRSPISVLVSDIGLERIAACVRHPLEGLKVATYYGCLLARPRETSELSDPEHPRELDCLMEAIGAQPVQWSFAVDCCGGSLSLTRADIARRMTQTIINAARDAGAAVIITACPLCQANLEMRQTVANGERLPAIYFTEAMGLAFGLRGADLWWKKHLIDPRPLLRSLELV